MKYKKYLLSFLILIISVFTFSGCANIEFVRKFDGSNEIFDRVVIELDKDELERINDRLDFLNDLKRKYNKTISEIIVLKDDLQNKISKIVQSIIYDKKHNKNADISSKEEQLNQIIYSAFGLTDAEIKIIEQSK